jgi:hypothetical protein
MHLTNAGKRLRLAPSPVIPPSPVRAPGQSLPTDLSRAALTKEDRSKSTPDGGFE